MLRAARKDDVMPGTTEDGGVRILLFTGKGGVGKTTLGAATAIRLARERPGERILLTTLGSPLSLGGLLGSHLSRIPRSVAERENLHVCAIDPADEWTAALEREGPSIRSVLRRATGAAEASIERVLGRPWPALEVATALGRLDELLADRAFARVVVDGDPTGQALDVLALPDLASEWIDVLDRLLERDRAFRRAFGRRGVARAPAAMAEPFLTRMRETLARVDRELRENGEIVVVTAPGEVVLRETERLVESLRKDGRRVRVVFNRWAEAEGIPESPGGVGRSVARELREPPRGIQALASIEIRERPPLVLVPASRAPVSREAPGRAPTLRFPDQLRLLVVGGKGGVGKTTLSLALALAWPRRSEANEVQVVSVDPAHSLLDALAQDATAGSPVRVAPGVTALELDFGAVYERRVAPLRQAAEEAAASMEHRSRSGRAGFRLAFEPQALREVLGTLPPGLDAIAALLWVAEAVAEDPDRVIVLDTPPANHFARILRTHGAAREHLRTLLRTLLQEPAGRALGPVIREIGRLAEDLDRLGSVLRDASQTQMVLVATPTEDAWAEAGLLAAAAAEAGLATACLVENEKEGSAEAAPGGWAASPVIRLPRHEPEPRGVEALGALVKVELVAR